MTDKSEILTPEEIADVLKPEYRLSMAAKVDQELSVDNDWSTFMPRHSLSVLTWALRTPIVKLTA